MAISSSEPGESENHFRGQRPQKRFQNNEVIKGLTTRLTSVRETLRGLQQQQKNIFAQIAELTGGRADGSKEVDELHEKLAILPGELDKLESKRAAILAEIAEATAATREQVSDRVLWEPLVFQKDRFQSVKRAVGFQSREEIDMRIAALERAMVTQKLSLPEENKIVNQIKQLRAQKVALPESPHQPVAPPEESAALRKVSVRGTSAGVAARLKASLEEVKEAISAKLQEKKQVALSVKRYMKKTEGDMEPIRELSRELDRLKQKIAESRAEEASISAELATKTKEYQAHLLKVKKEKFEKKREETRLMEYQKKKQALEDELAGLDEVSISAEHQLLIHTIHYIKNLISTLENAPVVVSDSVPKSKPCELDGKLAYVKDDKEDFYYAPVARQKAERKKKKHPAFRQLLQHPVAVLADFQRLGCEPPYRWDDCGSCLQNLEAKLQVFEKQQVEAVERAMARKEELLQQLKQLEEIQVMTAT